MKKYLSLFPVFLLISCSQFSTAPTSRAWHNLNAKYNALWIAKFNYRIIEDTLFQTRKENYTQILPILLPVDTIAAKTVARNLEEVIRKSSIVAERHSNSKFLDEAYNILGNARIIKGDFINAAEVFKYINTNGKNENQKHLALISLMRTFIEQGNLNDANEVANILKTLPLSKESKTAFFITKAYFHQQNDEELIAAAILDEVLPDVKKGEKKARLHFIAGQIFEKYNRFDLASKQYAQVLKNNPNYDLEFNSIVNQLATNESVSSFKTLLSDRKNTDLKDKIYLKMGEIEVENKNFVKAIDYFKQSTQLSTTKEQKAKGYFAIAQVYYSKLSNLEKAASYYDSTLTSLSPNDPLYAELIKKTNSLKDFVRYSSALKLEDSLQVLAQMNPVELNQKIEELIAAKNTITTTKVEENTFIASIFTTRWELYDPVKLNQQKAIFFKTWGTRALEDDWRRKEKQAGGISFKLEKLTEEQLQKEELAKKEAQQNEKELAAQKIEAEKAAILEKIPTTEAKLLASKRKQEEAIFNLAKIYKQQFGQEAEAKKMYLKLINEFPESGYVPEALYALALMEENQNQNAYKSELIAQFPGTTFARQLLRGKVEITSSTELEANEVYKFAYQTYANGQFTQAAEQANEGLQKYMGTSIEEKFALLRILSLAKGTDKIAYRIAIEDFITSYPTSKSLDLIKGYKNVLANNN